MLRAVTWWALVLFVVHESAAEAEGRWVWGRGAAQKRKYVAGGIDDGFLGEGPGVGVLGGNGVKFGLGGGGGPGGPYRPQPPPVHEGPVLAGPGGPIGVPGYRPGGIGGGPGYPGPGIGGGPGYPGPGIKGPGFGGPGIGGGPGYPGPGIGGGPGYPGPGIKGPGFGGPGYGPPGSGPGILTGPVPSWEQERLDALGVGHRYHSFDSCSCVHSFNCKEPALKFGKCDKDKQYCCNGIRSATEGHGVRRPPHPGGPIGGPIGGPHGGPIGGPHGGPIGGPHGGPIGGPHGGPIGGPHGGPPFPFGGPEFARSAKAADEKKL
ncbi:glycine-rich cell wall structural protein 1-like [Ischnura elegans]|uniref:glycine-rich cell wall structural protein 1-like n=1 Tax=Ischnura elegans TaxID=197161 RepID=UPI001ED870CE|nr:glycine-rich cell wall structural protein 1-like [Ischnura elegans]